LALCHRNRAGTIGTTNRESPLTLFIASESAAGPHWRFHSAEFDGMCRCIGAPSSEGAPCFLSCN
jgi:hypothetical protein